MELDRTLLYILNRDIELVASKFVQKYFVREGLENFFIVGQDRSDELNTELIVNEYYHFSMVSIFQALWYDIPRDVVIEWYEKEYSKKTESCVTLKNYYLLTIKEQNVG